MFWETGKNVKLQPNHKFNFIAQFTNFKNNRYKTKVFLEENYLNLAVKKFDLPKIKFDFERSYANQLVHYFQNGPIYWEPITITFMDALPFDYSNKDFSNVKRTFFNYLRLLPYTNASQLTYPSDPDNGDFVDFITNTTSFVDLPIFCDNILIYNFTNYANSDYPTGKELLNVREGNATNQGRVSVEALGLEATLVEKNTLIKDGIYIVNPRITNIDFGSVDYSSDEINEISITVVPEACTYYDSTV